MRSTQQTGRVCAEPRGTSAIPLGRITPEPHFWLWEKPSSAPSDEHASREHARSKHQVKLVHIPDTNSKTKLYCFALILLAFSFFKCKQMLIKCLNHTYMHGLTTLIPTKSPTFSTHQNQLDSYKAHAMSHHTQLKNSVCLCCFPFLIVLKTYTENHFAQ